MRPLPTVVLMGVSGCGKSTVGPLLARELGADYEEGDAFHPPANVAKMRSGAPLDDADRAPWLAALAEEIRRRESAGRATVLSCSALRARYRETLAAAGGVCFVWLKGARALVADRLAARRGHFMPPALLDSQFAALETPHDAVVLDIALPPDEIARRAAAELRHAGWPQPNP